jgi:hypothetical protein
VADLFYNIAEKVLFAKDFIASAASNEPYTALACAGVSMILPVSTESFMLTISISLYIFDGVRSTDPEI